MSAKVKKIWTLISLAWVPHITVRETYTSASLTFTAGGGGGGGGGAGPRKLYEFTQHIASFATAELAAKYAINKFQPILKALLSRHIPLPDKAIYAAERVSQLIQHERYVDAVRGFNQIIWDHKLNVEGASPFTPELVIQTDLLYEDV